MSKNLLLDLKYILNQPFEHSDITAGCENEFQVAVEGDNENVDLPDKIINSKFYNNLKRRVKAGDSPSKLLRDLEALLSSHINLWENSWVRIEESRLTKEALSVFKRDLLKDKNDPKQGFRSDISNFFYYKDSKTFIRIPVSYLLKIALIDLFSHFFESDIYLERLILYLSKNFLNDNTSPEVTSFYISENVEDIGLDLAKETGKRFLFIQLLIFYANHKFGLIENNQKVYLYNSPLTPEKQKKINSLIPDELYRELFISPCLSGWDRGEEKKVYMYLCHSVLSKSKLNTLKKLKDGGFIKTNLVVLPDTSNTCLANNGTHISIGSKKISNLLSDKDSKFNHIHEKYYGDLAIKIVEHFLPLFPGIYSASPYRLSFKEMHPEVATGFLAHELDFTFLRMIWRRWQKKARMIFFNRVITPTGLDLLDDWIAKILNLKGDYVPDYRLIDYFVTLMSTDNVPALNGELDNQNLLKEELESMGIFNKDMAFYTLFRLRNYSKYGFSGFESRYYSNFSSINQDLRHALNLKIIITALAYKYIIKGELLHNDIPDTPTTESERRQIFFCSAIGIPTFYVRVHTENNFLKRILSYTSNSRYSRRYNGYVRVYLKEYLKALIKIIEQDAKEILLNPCYREALYDCKERIEDDNQRAHKRIINEVLKDNGKSSPLDIPAHEFNSNLEEFYRIHLRNKHIKEGIEALKEDATKISLYTLPDELKRNIDLNSIKDQIESLGNKLLSETLTLNEIKTFASIILSDFFNQIYKEKQKEEEGLEYATSIR
ncbi:MAG: hypothetical protein N2647_00545 [Thermodesulfovibrio sp.]|nr:hypothetical protein [Thermodesulfovibrio sp.]